MRREDVNEQIHVPEEKLRKYEDVLKKGTLRFADFNVMALTLSTNIVTLRSVVKDVQQTSQLTLISREPEAKPECERPLSCPRVISSLRQAVQGNDFAVNFPVMAA